MNDHRNPASHSHDWLNDWPRAHPMPPMTVTYELIVPTLQPDGMTRDVRTVHVVDLPATDIDSREPLSCTVRISGLIGEPLGNIEIVTVYPTSEVVDADWPSEKQMSNQAADAAIAASTRVVALKAMAETLVEVRDLFPPAAGSMLASGPGYTTEPEMWEQYAAEATVPAPERAVRDLNLARGRITDLIGGLDALAASWRRYAITAGITAGLTEDSLFQPRRSAGTAQAVAAPRGDIDDHRTEPARTVDALRILTRIVSGLAPDTQIVGVTAEGVDGEMTVHLKDVKVATSLAASLGLIDHKVHVNGESNHHQWKGRVDGHRANVVAFAKVDTAGGAS
jgi:hypothetical protein